MESIWDSLKNVDVNEHTEKKGKFTYLSWTWAWAYIKGKYPTAQYKILPDTIYPDGTMEVRMEVTIQDLSHTMWLYVMDFNNRSVPHPNAQQINTTRMRCLVKCLAMFGLGHYIYAGESTPSEEDDVKVVNKPW